MGQAEESESAQSDCFKPPAEPCECYCLHCQRVVMSSDMWFQEVVNGPDGPAGFWKCPTPNCGGAGFTFDLFPTDPNHPGNEGWQYDDGEDEPDDEVEYDPDEPQFADEIMGDDPDELEGEEWKLGLQPGERPPDPPEVVARREAREAQQRKYDEPDRRPRTIDGSGWKRRGPLPPVDPSSEITEDDIPF